MCNGPYYSHKDSVEQKKIGIKEYLFHESIYVSFQNRQFKVFEEDGVVTWRGREAGLLRYR